MFLAGYDSVWLFIAEQKTSDRTQYVDTLEGDILHMEGQLKGEPMRSFLTTASVA